MVVDSNKVFQEVSVTIIIIKKRQARFGVLGSHGFTLLNLFSEESR